MQYRTKIHLNLYSSPDLQGLVTQAAAGRWLEIVCPSPVFTAASAELIAASCPLQVRLCEDNYSGWLAAADWEQLEEAEQLYQAPVMSAAEIRDRLPQVIKFTQATMAVPNEYLWGGTVAPHYDCSGLMQAAFKSVGVQLPRDAYQQEEFVQPIGLADLQPGDLIFFGPSVKATHVGLYLGNSLYIHSSGKSQGRNGIGIDVLSPDGDAVSRAYYAELRGFGRVIANYHP